MKKTILLAIIVISIATLCSCGNITVKGADGTEYESYQECCAANDYEAAHKYLAKMQDDAWYGAGERKSAKEYVFKHEALFLMSIGDENAKKRIVYLLKEEGNNNNNVSMLIDLAIENDDEVFVKTLGNQYTKEAKSDDLKKLMEYLYSKQNEGNKEYLIGLLGKIGQKELMLDVGFKFHDIGYILNEIDTVKIENEILLDKLVQLNDKKVSDLIIGSLSPYENEIPEKPLRIGKYTSDAWNTGWNEVEKYNKGISRYNKMCNIILNSGITHKNQYIANRSLQKIKENLTFVESAFKGHDKNGNEVHLNTVSINKEDINNAKTKYQEAVRSGAFK